MISTSPQTNAPAVPADSGERLAYLDATRAFALILGVVFHASISFLPFFIGWAVQDVSTHPVVAVFMTVSHSFRMELFFLLAGFFTHMTLERKGLGSLLRSRAVRIAVPFVIGWFLLRPLVVSGWIMGAASMQGDYAFWPSVLGGIAFTLDTPGSWFTGTHLWFLYYLIMITGATLLIRSVLPSSEGLRRAVDGFLAKLARAWWTPLLAVPLITATLHFMDRWGVDTPDQSLMPHLPVLVIYGGFFGLGWLLDRKHESLIALSRITVGRVALLILGMATVLMLMRIQNDPAHPQFATARVIYHFGYAAMMWGLVWLTVGLFRQWFAQPRAWVRYVADSSYWMYLIHLPVVVWLQVVFAELPWHWSIKLTSISAITIALAIVTYDLFVRSTWIGHILNGRQRDRVVFRLQRR